MEAYIYRIYCRKARSSYIGSTIHPSRRRICHFNLLKRGVHHSKGMQRAFDKVGSSHFNFRILEKFEAETKEQILLREAEWIARKKANWNKAAPIKLKKQADTV